MAAAAIVVDLRDRQAAGFELDVAIGLEVDRRDRGVAGEMNVEVGRGDVDRRRAVGLAVIGAPARIARIVDKILRRTPAQCQHDQPAATHARASSKRRAGARPSQTTALPHRGNSGRRLPPVAAWCTGPARRSAGWFAMLRALGLASMFAGWAGLAGCIDVDESHRVLISDSATTVAGTAATEVYADLMNFPAATHLSGTPEAFTVSGDVKNPWDASSGTFTGSGSKIGDVLDVHLDITVTNWDDELWQTQLTGTVTFDQHATYGEHDLPPGTADSQISAHLHMTESFDGTHDVKILVCHRLMNDNPLYGYHGVVDGDPVSITTKVTTRSVTSRRRELGALATRFRACSVIRERAFHRDQERADRLVERGPRRVLDPRVRDAGGCSARTPSRSARSRPSRRRRAAAPTAARARCR